MNYTEKKIFEHVKTILVVDDKEENRSAATTAIKELFPEVVVLEASSAKEAKGILTSCFDQIDFVFSDMQMEEETSGFYVAFESWARYIPAVVVTAGDHHGSYVTASSFCNGNKEYGNYRSQPAKKDDPEVWRHIIKGIEENNNLSIQVALDTRESTDGKKIHSKDAGELLARIVCSGLANIRECQV